ncbi:uracil-DNA glycosylase [Sphingomonas sp. PB4P5]|uniref:uracil-DNA glycosylase n=1 Tax=Parasphingomonas puruogangriensis TaxID=3096155 RepID=UPI002FC8CA47
MGADQNYDWNQAAASAIAWWQDAGVDIIIDEEPRNWLARPAAAASVTTVATVAAPVALPETAADFAIWRAGADVPEATWHGPGIVAQGDPASPIMILIDMPEREDADSGMLLSGAAGKLFDRMLAAIGRTRETIYLAAVCTKRPAAGRVAPEMEARLHELAQHHVALTGAKRVLLMGNAPSRALLGADAMRVRGSLHSLNLKAGTIAAEIEAVASFHPRFLLEKPAAKAEAWKDLQMLIEGLES